MNPENPPSSPLPLPEVRPADLAAPVTNGTTNNPRGPGSSRLPRPGRWSKRRKILTAVSVAVIGALALGVLLWSTGLLFAKPPFTGATWTVHKEQLKLNVVARGSLESAKNGDIYCTVRSGTKGSTIATTIKSVVDAGTMVKEGEEVMVLDFSGFEEQKKDKLKDVNQAYASKVQADQQVAIQELDNENDIEKAKNAWDLAKIDLKKYADGDYPQAFDDVCGRIETAESDLNDWKTRAAWSAGMVKKGLMSKVQADADVNRVEAAVINLKKLIKEREVLVDFTKDRTLRDLQSKVVEADLNYKKTKLQAEFKLKYLQADQKTKESIYDLETSRAKEIEDQIKACRVKSPQAGLVVYYVPDQVRGGGGSQQAIVAQGEPVREGQKMLQIPDLDDMLVNVRVPEAFVRHLERYNKPGQVKKAKIRVDAFQDRILEGHVTFVDTVASTQDWFAADVKVYKTLVSIDVHHKLTDEAFKDLREAGVPDDVLAKMESLKNVNFDSRKTFQTELHKLLRKKEAAQLRVTDKDLSKEQHGENLRLSEKLTISINTDMVTDAEELARLSNRFYRVVMDRAKDPTMPGLKPGMSAEVTITAEEKSEPVLVVPVQSVVGTISMGADRKVFVVGSNNQVTECEIKVGISNERLVEVLSGLKEGDKVVEDPRPFLKDTDMKPGKSKGSPYDMPGGPGGDKTKGPGGKKDSGGGGPPPGGKGKNDLKPGAALPPRLDVELAWVERHPELNRQ
jgi:multidrug efflux pump subunit AcrA (membrane-fusion protein)